MMSLIYFHTLSIELHRQPSFMLISFCSVESIQEIVARSGLEAMAMISSIAGAIGKMENTSKLYNHNNQVFDDLNHSEGNQL
jgi:hypothetical protein